MTKHIASLFLRKLHFSTDSVLRKHSNLDLWLARQFLALLPGYSISYIYILSQFRNSLWSHYKVHQFRAYLREQSSQTSESTGHSLPREPIRWLAYSPLFPIIESYQLSSLLKFCQNSVCVQDPQSCKECENNRIDYGIYMLVEIHRVGFVYMRHSMLVLFSWLQNNNLGLVY